MQKLTFKIGAAVATSAFLASTFSGIALAESSCEISGNGDRSENNCVIVRRHRTSITKFNIAKIKNFVLVYC